MCVEQHEGAGVSWFFAVLYDVHRAVWWGAATTVPKRERTLCPSDLVAFG